MTSQKSPYAITTDGLTRSFAGRLALDRVSLSVPTGTVHGLLGPNGAGKTTLVRILATLLLPDSGSAHVAGHHVLRRPDAVRARLGLSGQYAAVDDKLTGRENLYLVARLYGMRRKAARRRAEQLLDRFRLTEFADRPSGTFSGGTRRRLDLAGALVARPPVVVLDEPTTGLDPRGRADIWEAVWELTRAGTTVLLTTQYLEEADQLADTITVIDQGRIVTEGTATQLKAAAGGERLSLRVPEPSHRDDVRHILTGLSPHPPEAEPRTGRFSLTTERGALDLEEALVRLRAQGIAVTEVTLAPPTLDAAFLALTGRATTANAPPGPPAPVGAPAATGAGMPASPRTPDAAGTPQTCGTVAATQPSAGLAGGYRGGSPHGRADHDGRAAEEAAPCPR